jgi:integrase
VSSIRSKYVKEKQEQQSLPTPTSNQFAATPFTDTLSHSDAIVNEFDDQKNNDDYDLLLFDKKVALATEGLIPFFEKILRARTSKENALIISEYIAAAKRDINLSNGYRKANIEILVELSKFHSNKKNFKEMTREDILLYLDSLRRPEESDPLHKWIGTYNLYLAILVRFFKWLYYPDVEPSKRSKPQAVENIAQLKRREQSIYKPTDLWTQEDDLLFLKYCPSKRDRCYHATSRDLSCRPHEILNIRIRDVAFKITGNCQYAEVLVNGKTGSRHIPLISSIPYLKDWLDSHPQRGNSNAFLIPSVSDRSFGKNMSVHGLLMIYRRYKLEYFAKLLEDPTVIPEDKQKIKELLKKPWNPYIRRHSALTEKSKILKEHVLRQHSGWSPRSQMHLKYIHYFGNESSESLLEAYGIVTRDQQLSNALKSKQCPNCNEPNKPDSKFCAKCRMVLTYDAYNESLEKQQEKESEVQTLKEKYEQEMKAMREEMNQQLSQIMSMIQQNPKLAQIKPEALIKKTTK